MSPATGLRSDGMRNALWIASDDGHVDGIEFQGQPGLSDQGASGGGRASSAILTAAEGKQVAEG